MRQVGARVHAAAFGFSKPGHVLRPLKIMEADAFFLLENPNDRAFQYHLKQSKVNVHKLLDRTGIPWEVVEVDLWNPSAIGGALRRVVRENELEKLFVNASVGPNTVAVGAALASLFAPIKLFHPGGKRPEQPLQQIQDLRWLPTLTMSGWSGRHIALLDALHAHGGQASGTDVKEWLRQHAREAIGAGSRSKDNWSQREHARFQQLLERLREAGAVVSRVSHRRMTLEMTPEGAQLRLLLSGL